MESTTIVLNAATVAVLLGILVRSFSIGQLIGKYEASIDNLAREVTGLRSNVHRLSNDVARLSGRDELRTVHEEREGERPRGGWPDREHP